MAKIPGPPDPFWRQLRQIRRDFLGYLVHAGQTYGDLVRLQPVPGNPFVLINHPDIVHDILVGRSHLFHKSPLTHNIAGKFLGNGIVTSEDEFHKKQRRLVQPAFHRRRIEGYANAMVGLTDRYTAEWASGDQVDFHHEITELTLQIVASALFGAEDQSRNQEISEIMGIFGRSMSQRFRSIPWPEWIPTKSNREQAAAIRLMAEFIQQMVDGRRQSGEDGGDLLSMLLMAQDAEDGSQMDDKQIHDEVVTLFFAGHETTAQWLTWVIYVITQFPEVEARLRDEIDRVLNGRFPTMQDLSQLIYTDQVLKETLRLYPPAWVFDRAPIEDVEVDDYRLKKGVTLYLSPYVAHRDPRFFEDPETFNPDRFEEGWDKKVPRYAYFPFGGGRRVCIGQSFAEMESKLILATLLPQFKFSLATAEPIVEEASATLRPKGGLPIKVERIA